MSDTARDLPRSGVVHFAVEPAFIAERVRDCVASGDWRQADRILSSLMDAQGKPPAEHLRYAVAAGTMTLDGPMNEPAFVDWTENFRPATWTADRGWGAEDTQEEERQRHLKQVRWLYAGMCRTSDGSLWRPYAVVSGGTQACAEYAAEVTGDRTIPARVHQKDRLHEWQSARARFYASDRRRDRVEFQRLSVDAALIDMQRIGMQDDADPGSRPLPEGATRAELEVPVLWHRVEDPPVWYAPASKSGNFDNALAVYLGSGRRLETRGPGVGIDHYNGEPIEDTDWDDDDEDGDDGEVLPDIFGRPSLVQMQATQALHKLRPDLGPDPLRTTLDRMLAESAQDRADVDADATPAQQAIQRTMARRKRVLALKQTIEERAAGLDAYTLEWLSADATPLSVEVPRKLIAAYAVYRLRATTEGPASGFLHEARTLWPPVCPVGMKTSSDDAWHSDLVLACGFDLDSEFGRGLDGEGGLWMRAVHRVTGALQQLHREHRLGVWVKGGGDPWVNIDDGDGEALGTVICGGGTVRGIVVRPGPDTEVPPGSIVVVPHSGVEHYMAAVTAHREGGGAIVAETGGQLSHLAVHGIEQGFRILVVEDALGRFNEGDEVIVNMGAGAVRRIDSDV